MVITSLIMRFLNVEKVVLVSLLDRANLTGDI